jgi:hypothetical protein
MPQVKGVSRSSLEQGGEALKVQLSKEAGSQVQAVPCGDL